MSWPRRRAYLAFAGLRWRARQLLRPVGRGARAVGGFPQRRAAVVQLGLGHRPDGDRKLAPRSGVANSPTARATAAHGALGGVRGDLVRRGSDSDRVRAVVIAVDTNQNGGAPERNGTAIPAANR